MKVCAVIISILFAHVIPLVYAGKLYLLCGRAPAISSIRFFTKPDVFG